MALCDECAAEGLHSGLGGGSEVETDGGRIIESFGVINVISP